MRFDTPFIYTSGCPSSSSKYLLSHFSVTGMRFFCTLPQHKSGNVSTLTYATHLVVYRVGGFSLFAVIHNFKYLPACSCLQVGYNILDLFIDN